MLKFTHSVSLIQESSVTDTSLRLGFFAVWGVMSALAHAVHAGVTEVCLSLSFLLCALPRCHGHHLRCGLQQLQHGNKGRQ